MPFRISRRRLLESAALAAGSALLPSAATRPENNWPSHGHDLGQTRHNLAEAGIRPENVSRLEPKWEFQAGSGITGTPAVVGNRVIAGSWDGRVYALDRRTGARVWTFETGVRRYPPDRRLGVFASPAVGRGRIIVACDRLIALDLERGTLAWEKTIGDPDRTFEYFWAAPLVSGHRVYAGVSSGSETEARGRVVSLNLADGRPVWAFYTAPAEIGGGGLVAPPSLDLDGRTLYAATGNPYTATGRFAAGGSGDHTSSLIALDAESGALRWADQVHPNDTRNFDLNCPPMLVSVHGRGRARRLVIVGGKDGLRAWDRDTRERLWHVQLTPPLPPNGKEALPTTGPEAGPTAAAEGLVFFASNNHADRGCLLAAIDPSTGEQRWLHSLPAFQFGPMSVAGGVVFLGLVDGRMRAWRASDGEPLWESPAGQPIAGGPAIARGMLFVGTGAGDFLPGNKLLAFGLP